MPFEVGDVVVRRLDDRGWTVVEPLVYVGTSDRSVVPAGYVTDFATVPRVVVWLVPRFGRYTAAAILHDWPNRGCGRRPARAPLRRSGGARPRSGGRRRPTCRTRPGRLSATSPGRGPAASG
ncbi:DUF1353 domain-containing protein [Blastococcus sp. SYSU DS0973]